MTFKVGDRVMVITTQYDTPKLQQSGEVGKIDYVLTNAAPEDRCGFRVVRDCDGQAITYYPEHLIAENLAHKNMPLPEMELDEIERGIEIMESLNERAE